MTLPPPSIHVLNDDETEQMMEQNRHLEQGEGEGAGAEEGEEVEDVEKFTIHVLNDVGQAIRAQVHYVKHVGFLIGAATEHGLLTTARDHAVQPGDVLVHITQARAGPGTSLRDLDSPISQLKRAMPTGDLALTFERKAPAPPGGPAMQTPHALLLGDDDDDDDDGSGVSPFSSGIPNSAPSYNTALALVKLSSFSHSDGSSSEALQEVTWDKLRGLARGMAAQLEGQGKREDKNYPLFYLVHASFLADFDAFIEDDSRNPPPGSITNTILLEEDGVTLKKGLRKVADYRGLNQTMWDWVVKEFGGGPSIIVSSLNDIYNDNLKAPPPYVEEGYVGERNAKGEMHGQGKITFANGDVYEGQCEANNYQGQGKFTYASGNVYEGQWEADEKHGQGKYTFADGNVYEGQFEANKKHGQGKKTSASGKSLEGQWQNGKQVGLHKGFLPDGSAFEHAF